MSLIIPSCTIKPGQKAYWGNALGSGTALAIYQVAQQQPAPVLVITTNTRQAYQLEYELRFFNQAQPALPVLHFPSWETLPYDRFSPHQAIIADRLVTLYRLPQLTKGIVIVPIQTLMQKVVPVEHVTNHSLLLKVGDRFDLTTFRQQLQVSNYQCVSQVFMPGEFAVRGSLLDIFPSGSSTPYRIDLFGDIVDSIRAFDPDTQRSTQTFGQIKVLPAREYPLTEQAIAYFRQQWRETFSANPTEHSVYTAISKGTPPAGIEYFLPLFFSELATLLDYLAKESLLIQCTSCYSSAEQFWQEIQFRYEQLRHDPSYPLLPPEKLWVTPQALFTRFTLQPQLQLQPEPTKQINLPLTAPPYLPADHRSKQPLAKLQHFLQTTSQRVLFCAETAGRREFLLELLAGQNIRPTPCDSWQDFITSELSLGITIGTLEQGLSLQQPNLAIITEAQLFGEQVMQRRRRKQPGIDADTVVRNLAELTVGTPVVHIDYGIGRYLGLQILTIDDNPMEFLTLEYAGGTKLYLPVTDLHLISRYTGADSQTVPLQTLGNGQWEKVKRKAAEQIRDTAAELLDLYAKRKAKPGYAFSAPDVDYHNFASAFPFEETPDQVRAIQEVIQDLTAANPMDRLICGDVGFGKTEVAMRAAFLVVHGGKQVAVLVPTTLLAQQHYATFSDRFANWPVKIELLSRFRSVKQQQAIIQQLADGHIDIIIGTHKLLQKNVRFKDLGLVIIDEEHRFGVQQKERLKALCSEVDLLTLTATPIPRTLNMALSKIRDISLITTPPAKRLAIKTFIHERENHLIREAILRELMRGGQVYFVHNKVQTIARIARELSEQIPEAKIGIAHGQMHERELERIMANFYHQRFNVLVCTTIIETGIDIPTANTIIIDQADHFGLAQLHQLRGRVGRSHHQAYAYFLVTNLANMTPDAEKRLEAIANLEELGSGFVLANHDLEIRGAGELLGEQQSGQMQAIGFTLYKDLLERAIESLQNGKEPDLEQSVQAGSTINLNISALIPDDYLPDIQQRLVLYKRIASAPDKVALKELEAEMIDRFGPLPETTKRLFALTRLKLRAQSLGIRKIEGARQHAILEFVEKPNVEPAKIIQLIQQQPNQFQLASSQKLKYTFPDTQPATRLQITEQVLTLLE